MDELLNEYFNFEIMREAFPDVIRGFWFTIKLSVLAGILSLIWGLILAVLRQTPGKLGAIIRWPTIAYIDIMRGLPQLIIILLVFGFFGELADSGILPIEVAIPRWFGQPDPFWYGTLAITLCYGAYMAEVYRAGIEAVPPGQTEAARSLGMSHGQSMRYVIVPQALRKVIPPLLNDFIALMKDTSLVAFIGLQEVVQVGRDVQQTDFNSSALMLGAILYLIVTIPLARLLDYLIARQQRRESRGGGDDDNAGADPSMSSAGGVGLHGG
ncbi:MAG TPA: amino acid ABC transporter permease [Solirubrobacterales bacterium]|nr:amino acid ABC transporter permease [Solirubrobacterales bacterium]